MEFQIEITTTKTFKEGFGVWFQPIYDDDDAISDIAAGIVEIRKENVEIIGAVPCVKGEGGLYFPVENFVAHEKLTQDDTHDFRDAFFATREEAQAHKDYTLRRWQRPQPWESFVTF